MSSKNRRLIMFFSLNFLFASLSHSQKTGDFVGNWKVVKVELSPTADEEEKQSIGMIRQIFLKSTFHFKADSSFSFDAPDKDLVVKDGIWQFDSNKKYIKVTERPSVKAPGQLMGITVAAKKDNYLFAMDETPLILTVSKK